jgi:hypothetical protein
VLVEVLKFVSIPLLLKMEHYTMEKFKDLILNILKEALFFEFLSQLSSHCNIALIFFFVKFQIVFYVLKLQTLLIRELSSTSFESGWLKFKPGHIERFFLVVPQNATWIGMYFS